MKKKAYLMVLALCAALAITACGTSTDQKDDKKPAAEAQDTTDKEDSMCHFQIKALRLAEGTASISSSKSSEKQSGRAASEVTHLTLKRYAKD